LGNNHPEKSPSVGQDAQNRDVTDRRARNLRRGGVPATTETARRAREAKAALAADGDRLAAVAAEDPYAAYEEIHATMTRSIVRLLRTEERSNGNPSREVTDRLREYRQLTEVLAEYRRSRGADVEADAFFSTLEQRLESMADVLTCPACGTSKLGTEPMEEFPG
jgi:hypothetical protein